MDLVAGKTTLTNLATINVVLGKNGVGKSELLRKLDVEYENQKDQWLVKYISPERGGELAFDASVEQNVRSKNWLPQTRRRNRVNQFRQMSFTEYRNLEVFVLRKREKDCNEPTFDDTLASINALLDHVKIVRSSKADPEFRRNLDGKPQEAETLSSGESELVSIAIEILSFCHQADHPENAGKQKLLLLDEPDVHLHPDLQDRLVHLVHTLSAKSKITTVMATHSTAILGALRQDGGRVAFLHRSVGERVEFKPISQQLKDIIPVFGAHPLTNVFAAMPLLLVEGEDDVRIWQQAVRSSQGRLALWPCEAGDIQSLDKYEAAAADVIAAVYDGAIAYSLRDRDDKPYDIEDRPNVVRMRLFCRAAENLLLSDEALAVLGITWNELQAGITAWINANATHPQTAALTQFAKNFDRTNADIKDLRTLFVAIAGKSKPWELVVGQAIAGLSTASPANEGGLKQMLGDKLVRALKLADC